MSRHSSVALSAGHRVAGLLSTVAAAALSLHASAALACESNAECKAPRVCQANVCVSPPESVQACSRDIDCPGDDVCEDHVCVPVLGPAQSGEFTSPSGPGSRQKSAEAPPTPAPSTAPSAPPATPPPPPPPPETAPAAPASPPPPPAYAPPPYPYRRYHVLKPTTPPLMPLRFDLYAGAGFLWGQPYAYLPNTLAIAVAIDAQLGVGVAPNVALAARAGTNLTPGDMGLSTVYGAGGIYLPWWHWGVFVGGGSAAYTDQNGNDIREPGFVIDVPYDVELAKYFRLGIAIGLGFYRDFTQETLRLEVGF